MKRLFSLLLTFALAFVLVGCGAKTEAPAVTTTKAPAVTTTKAPVTTVAPKTIDPEQYTKFMAIKDGTENVVVESYILAKTAKNEWGNVNLYLGDANGGYYVYRMAVTETQYDELAIGKKVKITGTKTSWRGESEFEEASATYEMMEGTYTPTALDLTESFADTDALAQKNNFFVEFKGLTVAAQQIEGDDTQYAWLYGWDGSGAEGSDLYIKLTKGETSYVFLVESDLCGADTDVYKALKELTVGVMVNVEGFLYFYNGPQMHITKVTVVAS